MLPLIYSAAHCCWRNLASAQERVCYSSDQKLSLVLFWGAKQSPNSSARLGRPAQWSIYWIMDGERPSHVFLSMALSFSPLPDPLLLPNSAFPKHALYFPMPLLPLFLILECLYLCISPPPTFSPVEFLPVLPGLEKKPPFSYSSLRSFLAGSNFFTLSLFVILDLFLHFFQI